LSCFNNDLTSFLFHKKGHLAKCLLSAVVCRASVLIATTGVFTSLHALWIAAITDLQIHDLPHGHGRVMSKRERIFWRFCV